MQYKSRRLSKEYVVRLETLAMVICAVLGLLFIPLQAAFFDDFNSYADGDLETVSGGIWIKEAGSYVYPLQIGTIDGSKKAYMTAEYHSSQPRFDHYVATSNAGMPNGGADYTVSVDLDFDESAYGLDNNATMGVIARRQSDPFDYVYAQISFQDVDLGSGTATLYLFTTGGSFLWASNVPLSTLENNSGSIAMTLAGENVHVAAGWDSVGSKLVEFTVSGDLLNAGPAGVIARDRQGTNYYYVTGAFDNFRVDPEPPLPASCADSIARGYGLPADLNEDCYVNMPDFSVLANQWLHCSDPNDVDCDPFWWRP